MSSLNWMRRYQAGRRGEVWLEIRQFGAMLEGDARTEAQLVCDEMARRARQNVEELVRRLRADGYVFYDNATDRRPVIPHHVPGPAAPTADAQLIEHFGSIPLTLRSWLAIVGDVWFVGGHPEWPSSDAADPLVIEIEGRRYPSASMGEHIENEIDAHLDAELHSTDEPRPFVLPVAPDRLHKANISGGPPYGFVLPDGCADGLFVGEVAMPFVDYLNLVFANGGFPGPHRTAEGGAIKRRLASDLLPL